MESPPQAGSHPQQKKYVVAGSRGLGGAQILFAGLLLTFGIVGMVLQTLVYFAGVPIWTGLVYLVTGILGVVSSHKNTKCVLIGLLAMSCLSVLMTLCGITTAAIAVDAEPWNNFPGPGECHFNWGKEHCSGLDIARYSIDAANLLFAVVELGLSIATIAICSCTLCKGGSRCCGEGGSSCCGNGNTGNSYQTMHEVGQGGRLVPLQNFANINYAPAHSAHAPSYVISSPIPPQHGDVQQGMAAGTGDQAMTQAYAQQQQQKDEPQQHQSVSPDAHAQPGYVSPPPGYNQA
ncbi:membrane-spanning 4-domains subfamily A member 6D-like isoform X1 [Branchiostoma lanceolatum]|uniref:membrane-spanning 4-domains subfamily A member 6D-like isoform X1 n=1 Tax=Branchiostoma lanceolatum TaxID=7740 RepID=UPI0034538B3D